MLIHRMGDKAVRRNRAAWALEQVRLFPIDETLANYPHTLSGGQRQRVTIARSLVNQPAIREIAAAAAVETSEGNPSAMKTILTALGLKEDATEADACASIAALTQAAACLVATCLIACHMDESRLLRRANDGLSSIETNWEQ